MNCVLSGRLYQDTAVPAKRRALRYRPRQQPAGAQQLQQQRRSADGAACAI